MSAHVFFWASVLVGDDVRDAVLDDGSHAVVLERQPVTAHLAGVPATLEGEEDLEEYDDEMDELEGELERLAALHDEDDDG